MHMIGHKTISIDVTKGRFGQMFFVFRMRQFPKRHKKSFIVINVIENVLTVNSSPYAVDFYHKRGFRDTGAETVADGIRFTPMEIRLKKC